MTWNRLTKSDVALLEAALASDDDGVPLTDYSEAAVRRMQSELFVLRRDYPGCETRLVATEQGGAALEQERDMQQAWQRIDRLPKRADRQQPYDQILAALIKVKRRRLPVPLIDALGSLAAATLDIGSKFPEAAPPQPCPQQFNYLFQITDAQYSVLAAGMDKARWPGSYPAEALQVLEHRQWILWYHEGRTPRDGDYFVTQDKGRWFYREERKRREAVAAITEQLGYLPPSGEPGIAYLVKILTTAPIPAFAVRDIGAFMLAAAPVMRR